MLTAPRVMPSLLVRTWPRLADRIDWVSLGRFPTPIQRLAAVEAELGTAPLYVKRDDLSSPLYGGNKVRTLEALLGLARTQGATRVAAVGAYGSNHAVATVLHAANVGFGTRVMLFPQPLSVAALENLRVSLARANDPLTLEHWSSVPFAMWQARRAGHFAMAPGGATPHGALGYVAAAFELASQIQAGELECPRRIYVGIGSACTTAGLALGLVLAARAGLFVGEVPTIVAVRVSPWPVTSRFRVLDLARRTAAYLAGLVEDAKLNCSRAELGARFVIDGRELGPGYGRPTAAGLGAIELFKRHADFALDTTYSAKAAAGFLRSARAERDAPTLFWSTKSTAVLPVVAHGELGRLPRRVRAWLASANALV